MLIMLEVLEISEQRILFENERAVVRDSLAGKPACEAADLDLVFLIAKGFFKVKKVEFSLALDWRTWAYRCMSNYHQTMREDEFMYLLD